jgi:uncharacterized membrane protein YeiH
VSEWAAPSFLPVLQSTIEVLAVLAFALSGIASGLRAGMDLIGVCFVAGVTALGGGTLRDLLLDRRPFFWIEQDHLLWMIIGLCVLASLVLRRSHAEVTERSIQIPDAVGLGLFSALGTQIALAEGSSVIVAILMGVFSSTLGGVLRDTFCNVIPKAFSDHQPYILLAVFGSGIVIGLDALGWPAWMGLLAGVLVTTSARILAILYRWSIPQWRP